MQLKKALLIFLKISILLSSCQLALAKNYTDCIASLGDEGGFCELSGTIKEVYPPIVSGWNNRFGDPKNVLVAWGGAAYDSVNKVFYFTGGGHADYAGNEVYSFDLKTTQWERLTDPSRLDFVGPASGSTTNFIKIPDIRTIPGASHSYDGLQYRQETGTILYNTSTPSGRLTVMGVSESDANFIGSEERKAIYEFNPNETETRNGILPLSWRKASHDRLYYPRSVMVDGSFIVGDKFKLYKAKFSNNNQTITGLTQFSNQPDWGDGFARYDAKRKVIWSIHAQSLLTFDAKNGAYLGKVLRNTKGKSLAIGEDGQLVIWDGCSTIETYVPETDTWTKKNWGDAGAQPCSEYNGYNRVYGKWQHVEGRVFAGVVNADHGVMIYVDPIKVIESRLIKKNIKLRAPVLLPLLNLPITIKPTTLAQRARRYIELATAKGAERRESSEPHDDEARVVPMFKYEGLIPNNGILYDDISKLQEQGLLPTYGLATHTVGEDLNIDWSGNGGERDEIGLFPEQHAAFIAGQTNLKDSILQAALAPPPLKFNHTHHPNEFWLPYLLTGNPVYIANLEATYASYKAWRSQPLDSAIKMMLGREGAWNLRDLVQLAYLERKGLTKEKVYIKALDATRDRWLGIIANPRADQAMFNIFDFNSAGANTHGFTGWMQAMLGQAINYTALITKDLKWVDIATWHFQHLLKSSGDKWPLKAVGYNHVFMIYFMPQGNQATWREAYDFAQTATWETIAPYTPSVMRNETYIAMPDNHVPPVNVKVGSYALTYANRAQYAYGWAALACKNSIERACEKAKQLHDEITMRGDRWNYKNAVTVLSDKLLK